MVLPFVQTSGRQDRTEHIAQSPRGHHHRSSDKRIAVTAHCKVSTDIPVSSLMAGSKMLTAEVLALTTRVDRHVAARTPLVRVATSVLKVSEWIAGQLI
jgi:hypothetical protein